MRLARDGLAPQGGAPHRGCLRAWCTGLRRRRGGRAPLEPPTGEACLAPLTPLAWPRWAVRSDTHPGLVPAVAPVVPHRRPPCWQVPSRRPLAAPRAAADAACKGVRRQTGREPGGDGSRQAPRRPPGHAGGWTGTGRGPSPGAEPTAPACHSPAPSASPPASAPAAAQVRTQCVRPTRSWRTLKGRPPLRLAGLEPSERLHRGAGLRLDGLAQRDAPRRAPWSQGLRAAFSPGAAPSHA